VLDATSGTALETLALDSPGALYALEGGRYALSVQTDAGIVQLIDGGVWEEQHGDHSHYFATDAAVAESSITGPTPVHVTQLDGTASIFMDGDGSVHEVNLSGLADGLAPVVEQTDDPHHGVAYRLDDGRLVSSFSDADGRATGIRLGDDGEVVAESAACPGLHGETEIGELLVFACADGILALDTATATITHTPYGAEGRTGTLVSDPAGEVAYGLLAGTTLLTFDGTALDTVALPGYGVSVAVADGGDALVAFADGTVARVAVDGSVVASAALIGEFDPESGHSAPRPAVIVEGTRLYVSDPASDSLIIAHADNLRVIETVALGFTPKSFALAR